MGPLGRKNVNSAACIQNTIELRGGISRITIQTITHVNGTIDG